MAAREGWPEDLPSEIWALDVDARDLWVDPAQRALVLEIIVQAWERGDAPALSDAVNRWDSAVAGGLAALGLPRGPIVEVAIEPVGRLWLGRKEPGCRLVIDGDIMRETLRVRQVPDDIFRTWVHESLHARQPFVIADARQHQRTKGYEEGMVEGLARHITARLARMTIVTASYNRYVAAYEALAAVVACDVANLWRALWCLPTGSVREGFVSVVDAFNTVATGSPLLEPQRLRLRAIADRLFDASEERAEAGDVNALRQRWEVAFR